MAGTGSRHGRHALRMARLSPKILAVRTLYCEAQIISDKFSLLGSFEVGFLFCVN